LAIGATGEKFTEGNDFVSLGTEDNTGYHIFRIAELPQTSGAPVYNVWRDGVLLANGVIGNKVNYGENMWFGGGGSDLLGTFECGLHSLHLRRVRSDGGP